MINIFALSEIFSRVKKNVYFSFLKGSPLKTHAENKNLIKINNSVYFNKYLIIGAAVFFKEVNNF
jgi:hypothetical protein